MQLETERLVLREMTLKDFDALYAVLADSDIMQHYPTPLTKRGYKTGSTKTLNDTVCSASACGRSV